MKKPKISAESGYEALRSHLIERASVARERYGPAMDLAAMEALLEDREFVRFPTQVGFDAEPLVANEFAWVKPMGERPSDGFTIVIHPFFKGAAADLPLLIAYQLVAVNYLDLATGEEAEAFGSTLLGIEREEYYQRVCELADSIPV